MLVTGLLILGLVAERDGLFERCGAALGRRTSSATALFIGVSGLVAVVTATLNLDTSVVFLTPVLVIAARRAGLDEAPFLYLSVLLANGASLLLPGSNLTNLIVLDHTGISAGTFALHMLAPWLAATLCVSGLVWTRFRRLVARRPTLVVPSPRGGGSALGLVGIAIAVVASVVLAPPWAALVVLGAGLGMAAVAVGRGRCERREVVRAVDLRVLVGLLGLAVALGTLGRHWSFPTHLSAGASAWQSAGLGALVAVLINNLPAASLLAAHPPADPYALLIGLNLGPNLVVTGALSALLWLQVARRLGARPSVATFSRLGLIVTPLSIAAAVGVLSALR